MNLLPVIAPNDLPNRGLLKAVMQSKGGLGNQARRIVFANIHDLLGGHLKVCRGMTNPSGRFPSLAKGVLHVVLLSAQKQVIRPNAPLNIAGVTHHLSCRDLSVRKFVGKPMYASVCSSSEIKPGVSVPVDRARPKPARLGLFDLAPNSLCHRLFHRPIIAHWAAGGLS